MEKASKNLKFAQTNMNRHSSRSHAVCRLLVEVYHSDASSQDLLGGSRDHLSDRRESKDSDSGIDDIAKHRKKSIIAMQRQLDNQVVAAAT